MLSKKDIFGFENPKLLNYKEKTKNKIKQKSSTRSRDNLLCSCLKSCNWDSGSPPSLSFVFLHVDFTIRKVSSWGVKMAAYFSAALLERKCLLG